MPHPLPEVRRAGFPLDHPYLEHCWTPLLGPSSTLLIRRAALLWRDAMPATVTVDDLSQQLGLGSGQSRRSPIWHTLDRVTRFGFGTFGPGGELHVYTEVAPVSAHVLGRLPSWSRAEHERLLTQHLDALARSASKPAARDPAPPARMAARLQQFSPPAQPNGPSLSR